SGFNRATPRQGTPLTVTKFPAIIILALVSITGAAQMPQLPSPPKGFASQVIVTGENAGSTVPFGRRRTIPELGRPLNPVNLPHTKIVPSALTVMILTSPPSVAWAGPKVESIEPSEFRRKISVF